MISDAQAAPETPGPAITTRRLVLRRWRDADRVPFAALNADPEVTRYLRKPLTREESDAFVDRIERTFETRGLGVWAVEVADTAEFIGFTGLWPTRFDAHFTPAIEVGWRLARSAWGHGYATEAAMASVRFGFDHLGLDEIVSFTAEINTRSIAVMRRIGMVRDPADDFDHPDIPPESPLRRHVLYRISPPVAQ